MVYLITGLFVLLDFLTGLVKAFGTKTFSSTKMRTGLFHKIGVVLCVVLGVLIDYTQSYVDIGFAIPVAGTICAYIVIMEISSIIENIVQINPELQSCKISEFFESIRKKE